MSLASIFDIAGSGMSAQSVRLNTISSNIANSESATSSTGDTYRARYPVFAAVASANAGSGFVSPFDSGGDGKSVQVMGIYESDKPLRKAYEPNHPLADEKGYITLPNVNVVEQMADMISASKSYESNVSTMQAAKEMIQRVLTLGQ